MRARSDIPRFSGNLYPWQRSFISGDIGLSGFKTRQGHPGNPIAFQEHGVRRDHALRHKASTEIF
jgi:hypothetical protein